MLFVERDDGQRAHSYNAYSVVGGDEGRNWEDY